MAAPDSLVVPLMASKGFVVKLPLNQLPASPEEMLDLLNGEAVPLSVWWDVAKLYLSHQQVDEFMHILFEGTSPEVLADVRSFFGKDPKYEQILFHCGLAALFIGKARDEKDAVKKADLLHRAGSLLSNAQKIDPNEQLPYLGVGQLALAKARAPAAPPSRRRPHRAARRVRRPSRRAAAPTGGRHGLFLAACRRRPCVCACVLARRRRTRR